MEPKGLVDADAVAAAIGLTRESVLRYARAGVIPSIRLSRRAVRFDLGAVLRSLDESARDRPNESDGHVGSDQNGERGRVDR